MDNKNFIRALLWAAVVFFGWQVIATMIWPPVPPEKAPDRVVDGRDAGKPEVGKESARTSPSGTVGASDAPESGGINAVGGPVETLTLGDTSGREESPYRMNLVVSTVGASVVSAHLSDFDARVGKDAPRYPILAEAVSPDGSLVHSFATEKLYLRNWETSIALGDVAWAVESSSDSEAVLSVTIRNDDTPVLKVRKTLHLPAQSHDSMRHDLTITYEFQNLLDERQLVTLTHSGPVGLPQEDLRFNDRALFIGAYEDEMTDVSRFAMEADTERSIYQRNEATPLVWSATANKYFVVFETPRAVEGKKRVDWINEIKSIPVSSDPEDRNHVVSLARTATDLLIVEPNSTTRRVIDAYVGPKSREAFQQVDDYVARGYDAQVVAGYSMGACAFMTPKSLTRFMIWMLNKLYAVVRNYGIAIIILVMVVRTMLHPITKKGQVNMMRMQQQMGKLSPKMAELKKKYANDKQKLNTETMKLYQQEGINPATGMLSSCLPMFLQMPIWIALFTSLNFNIDMRHQPFFWWINDLTAPDALIPFAQPYHIPLLSSMTGPITSFNLLPILVSIAMFAQQKLMPKPTPVAQTGDQADQSAQMQKMMPYMTLFFGLFFYNMPSGLNLYIGTSSFFGMLEQRHIRAHIERLKNHEESAAPVAPKKPKKNKGPSLFEKLKKAAEEAEKVKSTSTKKKVRK